MTLQICNFQGGDAFSSFKTRRLRDRLQATYSGILSVQARYVYLVAAEKLLNPSESARLAQLLDATDENAAPLALPDALTLVVSPRQGTVSPWASKAGDIARNCGFELHRLERLIEYKLTFQQGSAIAAAQLHAVQALLHDRMTESVWPDCQSAQRLLQAVPAADMVHVDILKQGKQALVQANTDYGLALADDEIDYLQQQRVQLGQCMQDARLHLEALRLLVVL